MSRNLLSLTTLAAAGLALAACSDDSGTPGTEPQLRISLAARAGTAAAVRGAALADPYTITDGSNTLVYESVQMVVRELELKRADRDVVCGDDDSSSDDDDSGDDDSGRDGSSEDRVLNLSDDDDCEELEFGPLLFDVPLGVGPERVLTVDIAPGIYDKLEFEIHKPESSDDAAFIAANPAFDGVSIRVTGTYNGTPFTYVTDLDEEQERALVPPLDLAETQATDLTFFVDIDRWFRTSGGTLVDPASANDGGSNEGLVEENIKNSIDAFEDEDRDGEDDDDSDDD